MTVPVQIGRATLYLGDCRDVLPTLDKVDAVVTDPPYGIDPNGDGYGRSGVAILGDKDLTVCVDGLHLANDLLVGGNLVTFHSDKNAAEFVGAISQFTEKRFGLVWDKKAPGMGGAIRAQHELITVFCTEHPVLAGSCFSVLSYYRDAELHPHMKPLPLMRKLVEVFTPNSATILDPFMGSGTTGVAAVQMGRDFIGIEREEKYFQIACRRIEDVQRQGDLFIESARA